MLPTVKRRIRLARATSEDREVIYRIRHSVYASELGQHAERPDKRLVDAMDDINQYVVASIDGEVVGFVSITPPEGGRFSIDRYLSPEEIPYPRDQGLYEVRLLTVLAPHRGGPVAPLLLCAALRLVELRGGTRIIAIGRREILDLYRRIGFEPLGRQIQSGAVTFELMSATVKALRERLRAHSHMAQRLEACVDWKLDVPMLPASCEHGGAFWEVLGEEFQNLDRSSEIINADVLDAWFPPAPGILAAIQRRLSWLLSTSPPVGCEGMVRAIARARGVEPRCILPGDGSSSLIYQVFRQWLDSSARVLILDPTYGEYAHILERVIRCRVDRLPLPRAEGYELDVSQLAERLARGYDLVVLVNPNSPTGRHVPRALLERALDRTPAGTRVWIDETYVEYAGPGESLETFAAGRENIAVCKSFSKVYALSGVRAAYLCAAPSAIDALRSMTPPWAVSLPAQMAAVLALEDARYYAARHEETRANRVWLAGALSRLPGIEIIPSDANFLLCHLGDSGPDASALCEHCRARGLFLRNAGGISPRLGDRSVRIAVKDAETNSRMAGIISSAYG